MDRSLCHVLIVPPVTRSCSYMVAERGHASELLHKVKACGRLHAHVPLLIMSLHRKYPYHLNGRLIFLVLAQVWLSITFALRNIMRERFVLRWAKTQPSSNAVGVVLFIHLARLVTPTTQPFVPRNLAILLLTITLFTLASFAVYNIAFGVARSILLPLLFRVPLVRSLLRPVVGHFIRGPWTLTLPLRHLSLESHAFILGVFTLANWEFAEALFDVYIPQVRCASTMFFLSLSTALARQSCIQHRRSQRNACLGHHVHQSSVPPLCLCRVA